MYAFSILNKIMDSKRLRGKISYRNYRPILVSQVYRHNMEFSRSVFSYIAVLYLICLLWIITVSLTLSGDIQPNPGPTSSVSSTRSFCSNDIYSFLNLPNHLSTVHYNVQSMEHKTDTLISEFSYFDIISFSETWLHNEVHDSDLLFPSFSPPERKDRVHNRYGGVLVYIKDSISYSRRFDLELYPLECIWVQIKLISNRNILYGVFYRPTNVDASYLSLIEDSIALARDTDISDLIVTGDFNLNTCNYTQSRKLESICSQLDLTQCIDEPTHFTENSASTIDLLFVSNKSSILTTGAGEP